MATARGYHFKLSWRDVLLQWVSSCRLSISLSHPSKGQSCGILLTTRTSWHLFCSFTTAYTHWHRKLSWGLLFQYLCSFYILSPLTHIMGCWYCFLSLLLVPTPLSSYTAIIRNPVLHDQFLLIFAWTKHDFFFASCLSEGLKVVLHPFPSPGEFASTSMFRFLPLSHYSIAKTRMVHDTL